MRWCRSSSCSTLIGTNWNSFVFFFLCSFVNIARWAWWEEGNAMQCNNVLLTTKILLCFLYDGWRRGNGQHLFEMYLTCDHSMHSKFFGKWGSKQIWLQRFMIMRLLNSMHGALCEYDWEHKMMLIFSCLLQCRLSWVCFCRLFHLI